MFTLQETKDQTPRLFRILPEYAEELLRMNRVDRQVLLQSGVIVSHRSDRRVAQAELFRVVALGILGHIDDIPSVR